MKQILPIIIAILFIFSTGALFSQASDKANPAAGGATDGDAKLAQAAANPIADMISLPFQLNFNFNQGPLNRYGTVLNFMPVLPFRISKKWNVITRTIIPIIQKPYIDSAAGSTYGIGNTNFNAFFVPPAVGIFTYGFGITMNIPSASTHELGVDAFGLGPTIVFLFMPGHWVIGATAGLTWAYKSQAEPPSGTDLLNTFFGQYFITVNLKKGWFINTMPMITANFNAPEGEQWTVPFGAGFGKIVHFKHIPVKFNLAYYYNAVQASQTPGTEYIDLAHDPRQPMGNANQSLVFQVNLMFPHKKH
jgi:hypothetical protein